MEEPVLRRALVALDPRAQLAWLLAIVVGILVLGDVGLATGAIVAFGLVLAAGALQAWLRLLWLLLPLALMIFALDYLGGSMGHGARTAGRLMALATLGLAAAQTLDGERMVAGLRVLRVPYAVTFVLVSGARFVPTAWSDLSRLRDSARLRGVTLDGPPWRQLAGWRLLLVPLVVATVRRGLQLGEAMEARAFGASPQRTIRHALAWRAADSLALLVAALYLAAAAAGTIFLAGLAAGAG